MRFGAAGPVRLAFARCASAKDVRLLSAQLVSLPYSPCPPCSPHPPSLPYLPYLALLALSALIYFRIDSSARTPERIAHSHTSVHSAAALVKQTTIAAWRAGVSRKRNCPLCDIR